MPLGPGVKYRYKKGTNIRLAIKGGKVIEVKKGKGPAKRVGKSLATR